jgi:hypothetical protein
VAVSWESSAVPDELRIDVDVDVDLGADLVRVSSLTMTPIIESWDD